MGVVVFKLPLAAVERRLSDRIDYKFQSPTAFPEGILNNRFLIKAT